MKKVLIAALLCAASSFAAWDKFPVLEDGKGEAKAGISSYRQGTGDDPGKQGSDIYVGVRYSPLQNLELLAIQELDGAYTLGARFQVIRVLAIGADVGFPILKDSTEGTAWSVTPSLQFSMDLLPNLLSLGSNVELSIYEYKEDRARGMDLGGGIELDLTIGKSLIWGAFDIAAGVSRSKEKGKKKSLKAESEGRGLELTPSIGYQANVTDNLVLGTWVAVGFGDKETGYGHHPLTTVGTDFSVKF